MDPRRIIDDFRGEVFPEQGQETHGRMKWATNWTLNLYPISRESCFQKLSKYSCPYAWMIAYHANSTIFHDQKK